MRFFRKPYFSVITSFIFLLVSCSENSTRIENETLGNRLLTDKEISEIGLLHNQYLEEALSGIAAGKFVGMNSSQKTKIAMISVNTKGLSIEEKSDIYESTNLNISSIKGKLSSNVLSFVNKVNNVLNSFSNYNDIKINLESIENQAKNTLTGFELDQVLIMLSVGKNSANFWLPEQLGGSNKGFSLLSKIDSNLQLSKNFNNL